MATNTYVALDKVTVETATSYIEFTGINQGYTDLVLVSNYAGSVNDVGFDLRVGNSSLDTGTNYSRTALNGDGTSAQSSRSTSQSSIGLVYNYGNSTTLNKPNFQITNLINYSNTTTYKSILIRSRGTRDNDSTDTTAIVGLWRSTSAINIIRIYPASGNILAGSTFSLYGIRAEGVSPAAKATGGAIYSDATYYYHVFASSGTFTPTQSLTADYLVVAGGGGGGGSAGNGNGGGGGGAGGFLSSVGTSGGGASAGSSLSLTAQAYTVTVGAGGAQGDNSSFSSGNLGTNGSDSVFASITATGGGGGGAEAIAVNGVNGKGKNGGSGGGGSSNAIAGARGAASSPTQGYAGGFGHSWNGGGGGGAGAVGQDGSYPNYSGAGGIGVYTAITDALSIGQLSSSHYYLAGGGGGGKYTFASVPGAGGVGGGGYGGYAEAGAVAVAGTANTGGGGGGNGHGYNAAAGGSGVVIVRYAKA